METWRWSTSARRQGYARRLAGAVAVGLTCWRVSLAGGSIAEAQAGLRARDELPASAVNAGLDLAPGVVDVEDLSYNEQPDAYGNVRYPYRPDMFQTSRVDTDTDYSTPSAPSLGGE